MKVNFKSLVNGNVIAILLGVFLILSSSAAEKPRQSFGKGNPFTVDELPNGLLKEKLQTISPQARGKAMRWLHSFSFNKFDAAEHIRVDNGGGIFYVCPDNQGRWKGQSEASKSAGHACGPDCSHSPKSSKFQASIPLDSSEISIDSSEPPVARASVPISSPPAYSSKPGSVNTLYMDFNGGYVPNTTQWGGPAGGWNCRAWSSDADRTTFSDSEQIRIRQMWERVAEDYAPYDINVTTDVSFDPDTYTGDKNKVGWLMITPNTDASGSALPHNGSGGVAYVGAFGGGTFHSQYSPSWVLDMSPADIAEATSHEFGHNVSLSHDTTNGGGGYYNGHGSNDISWGPIMGTGYGRNVSQWSQGEYYNYLNSSVGSASYYQQTDDDLAAINNFLPYRTDDHGNTNGTGTTVSPDGGGNFTETGIIERTNDPDVFHLSVGAGDITINAAPYRCEADTHGGNLDINLELYNSSGGLVAFNNPATATTASLAVTVSAGDYYLYVKPSGAGTPLNNPPTGYTVYASLGQYTITGNITLAGIAVIQSDGSTDVVEGGATDSYQLALGTAPTDNVVVTVTPDSQVTVDKASVTFTPSNWATPQTITVTAVDDALEEGGHTGTITHSASSGDASFNGISVGSVVAQITDNDNIVLTAPNGGEKWFVNNTKTITWDSQLGGNVKVELFKGGALNTVIVASTPNNGSLDWAVPQAQAAGTDYTIRVSSVEFPAREDTSDGNFEIIQAIYFTDCEDTDPGFTKGGNWEWGTPSGDNDAASAYSPTKMYDTNLSGTAFGTNRLTSIPIDCSDYTAVQLDFFVQAYMMYEEVQPDPLVDGYYSILVEVSNTGTDWGNTSGKSKILWNENGASVRSWALRTYNIADIADGQSTVYVRWSLVNSGGSYNWTGGGIALDDIKFTGTYSPAGPEMDVARGASQINDGGSDTVSGSAPGVDSQLTYTITNSGALNLTMTTPVTTTAVSNCAVSVDTQPGSSVSPAGTTNLVLTVTPSAAGAWSATVSIANNDSNENPYNWTISGTATVPAPEIAVSRGSVIADGGSDSVAGTIEGQGTQLTYTIDNTGNADLTVQNAVSSSASNCSVAIDTQPSSPVSGGGSTNLTVTVTPTTAAAWSFNLSVGNNDSNENPYNWSVSGVATPPPAPEIAVSRGSGIADGGSDSISSTSAGVGTQLTYDIDNTGNANLTLQNAVLSGQSNCGVVIDTQPSSPVSGGGATALVITVTPTAAGPWSFNVSVGNNDSDENPYNWTVNGSASITTTVGGTEDTYIDQGSAGTNYSGAAIMALRAPTTARYGLIRFDLSGIPAGSTVTGATLDFAATGSGYTGSIDIYNTTGGWTVGTANWTNSNGVVGSTQYGTGNLSSTSVGAAVSRITLDSPGIAVVQGWVNGGSNNGFSIKTDFTHGNGGRQVEICSFDHGTSANKPKLNVTYEPSGPSLPSVTLTVNNSAIAENGGSSTITATLSGSHTSDVTVNLAFTGTATGGGSDYSTSGSSILISAGSTTGTATVTAVDDAVDESNETVIVDVASVVNGTESGTQQEVIAIIDDDNAPSVTLSASTNTIAEASGSSTLTATLSNPSSQTVTVNLGYSGTASGSDYTASSNSITIAAGSTSGTATVTAIQDAIDESNETVIVDITSVSNGTENGTQSETITITDDDDSPSVTLSASTNTIAEASGLSTLTATLSNPSSQTVTVNLAYSGTATGGGTDYTASGSTITVSAGSTSGTATVTAVQDATIEGDETIIVAISSVTNGTENGTQSQTVTITDDDAGSPIVDVNLPSGISLYGYTGENPIDTKAAFQTLIDNSQLSLVRWVSPTGEIKELYYTTFPSPAWVNDIGDLMLGEGYVVKVTQACTLSISGNKDTSSVTHNLNSGYSIVGFNQETPMDAQAAFQPLIDAGKLDLVRWVDPSTGGIKELYYTTFPAPGWVNEIGDLTEGQGYIIKLNAAHSGFNLP